MTAAIDVKNAFDFIQGEFSANYCEEVFHDMCWFWSDDGEDVEDEVPTVCDLTLTFANLGWDRKGFTKRVLYFCNYPDVVFKIPFFGVQGVTCWNEDDTPEFQEWYYEEADYEGRWGLADDFDYCEVEAKIYEQAKREGVESFFAETVFLGKICGVLVYAAENCRNSYSYYHSSKKMNISKDSRRQACTLKSKSEVELSEETLSIMIEQQGVDKVSKLCNFLSTYDLEDFHDLNLAFDRKGILKIIDSSGYHENF